MHAKFPRKFVAMFLLSRPASLELLGLADLLRRRLDKLLKTDGLIAAASKRRTGRDAALRAMLSATDSRDTAIAIGPARSPNSRTSHKCRSIGQRP